MIYNGFCDKQNKNYSVSMEMIPAPSLEDEKPKFIPGRLTCKYASFTGCCNDPNQCSIIKNR